jgi:hypothetical protein
VPEGHAFAGSRLQATGKPDSHGLVHEFASWQTRKLLDERAAFAGQPPSFLSQSVSCTRPGDPRALHWERGVRSAKSRIEFAPANSKQLDDRQASPVARLPLPISVETQSLSAIQGSSP